MSELVKEGVHNYSNEQSYIRPREPEILEKLEWFQDQKLALMLHWGIFNQLGIMASWPLSDADAEWSRKEIDWNVTPHEFRKQYFNLNKSFNPIRFEPSKWAKIAKDAGMKYLIAPTKHHDGFCMWDTKYTDYKVTSEECPFHTHKYANTLKHLLHAFRKEGFGIATYFSKADWHIDSYWTHRTGSNAYYHQGPSYTPQENPELWEKFVQYTHNQILEIGTEYGDIDVLWFDAGWVKPSHNQDIRLGEVVEKVREHQPGILSVDRTVGGPYENYVTPEQTIPEKPLTIPWESCIPLGKDFSYSYDDEFKSPKMVIHLLIKIVSRGGNLALNVSPQPDGRIPRESLHTLEELGSWLQIYGNAIYETRICAPYQIGEFAFTQRKKEGRVFAIWMEPKGKKETQLEGQPTVQVLQKGRQGVPWGEKITIPYTEEITKITCMDTGEELSFTKSVKGYTITPTPATQRVSQYGRVFTME